MALVGYARVSTQEQCLDLQLDALAARGCDKTFTEHVSGRTADRPQLQAMLDYLRDGEDTVVVYKLDRLGRSLKDLIEITEALDKRNIGFVSLQDGISMDTASGRLYFHVMACLAEFERDLISERTKAGLAAARARGNKGGRRPADRKKLEQAFKLYDAKTIPVSEICKMVGISTATFYKYNRERREGKG